MPRRKKGKMQKEEVKPAKGSPKQKSIKKGK